MEFSNAAKKMRQNCLICCYILLLLATNSCALELTSLQTHIYDYNVIEVSRLWLVPHAGHNTVNGTTIFKIPLTNVKGHFRMHFRRVDGAVTRAANSNFDVCRMLDSLYDTTKLAHTVLRVLQKSLTFPQKCPIAAHVPYKLEYFYIDLDSFLKYVPAVNFTTRTTLSMNGKRFAEYVVSGYTKVEETELVGKL